MRWSLGLAVITVTLGLLPSASAGPGGLQIAFTAGSTFDQGDVVVLDARGEVSVNLTPGGRNPWDDDRSPAWSPDGTRLAFVSHRDANNTQEIYVMASDGSSSRRLTTDSGNGLVFNVDPTWSPDGSHIAWRKVVDNSNDEIAVMNTDGSGQRRLTADGGRKTAPQWSPDSTRLLYARQGSGIHVVDVNSGSARSLTPQGVADVLPRWSSDGTQIAFTGNDTIWVMSADGTGRRQVSQTRGLGARWSPDGTKLAFSAIRLFPEFGSRYGPAVRVDVFVANVDGTGEQRLTGPLDSGYLGAADGSAPTWWPDGSRLFFLRPGTITYVMNADGSCETRFAPSVPRLFEPAWKPGSAPGLPPIACADLRLRAESSTDAVGLKETVLYRLTIENDGNLAATGLRVRIAAPAGIALSASGCTSGVELTCELPNLGPRQQSRLDLYASSPVAGELKAAVEVSADPPDPDSSNNAVQLSTTVLPCTRVGTTGNDAITGTPNRDLICARAGWDRINALAGNDVIDAGNGNDTVDAGKGADTILGKGGLDVILARDGRRDTIDCGTERDLVLADRQDRTARNCERVLRR
jgi:Tol biopolymer transport system component